MFARSWSTAAPATFRRTRSIASASSTSTQRFGIDNIGEHLPIADPHPARECLKGPSVLDLLGGGEHARENSPQETLIECLTRFILELGKGFMLVGRQRHPQVGEQNRNKRSLACGSELAGSVAQWSLGHG